MLDMDTRSLYHKYAELKAESYIPQWWTVNRWGVSMKFTQASRAAGTGVEAVNISMWIKAIDTRICLDR